MRFAFAVSDDGFDPGLCRIEAGLAVTAQRLPAGVEVDRFIERGIPAFQPPDNGFKFLERFFKAEAGNFRSGSHKASIDGALGRGQASIGNKPGEPKPMQYAIAYVTAGVVFGAMDAVWLGWAGSRLYRPALGSLLAPQFRAAPAIVFYLMYLVGMTWFAVRPGLAQGPGAAALNGAIFGAMCYMTYDLTSQAVLARWPVHLTVIDVIWGTFATTVAATVAT